MSTEGEKAMNKNTFYEVLQVSRNADPETIKAAYKSLVQRYHPDKNPGNPDAEKRLKIINRAYEVLSDPVKRAGHDAAIAETDEDHPEWSGAEASTNRTAAKENTSGGASSSSHYAAPESERSSPGPRPWIRYWARTIDYVVWGVIAGFVIGLLA
jgi:curved DNA-binding protein CbpA